MQRRLDLRRRVRTPKECDSLGGVAGMTEQEEVRPSTRRRTRSFIDPSASRTWERVWFFFPACVCFQTLGSQCQPISWKRSSRRLGDIDSFILIVTSREARNGCDVQKMICGCHPLALTSRFLEVGSFISKNLAGVDVTHHHVTWRNQTTGHGRERRKCVGVSWDIAASPNVNLGVERNINLGVERNEYVGVSWEAVASPFSPPAFLNWKRRSHLGTPSSPDDTILASKHRLSRSEQRHSYFWKHQFQLETPFFNSRHHFSSKRHHSHVETWPFSPRNNATLTSKNGLVSSKQGHYHM